MSSWSARAWRAWSPPTSWPPRGAGCWSSTRRTATTWAGRRSGLSVDCSWSTAPSNAAWASGIPTNSHYRIGWVRRPSTGSTARTSGRAGGRRRMSVSRRPRSVDTCATSGCGWCRWWGGRSEAPGRPPVTATRCLGSTSRGGPVRRSFGCFASLSNAPSGPGSSDSRFGIRSTSSSSRVMPASASAAPSWKAVPRHAASHRRDPRPDLSNTAHRPSSSPPGVSATTTT